MISVTISDGIRGRLRGRANAGASFEAPKLEPRPTWARCTRGRQTRRVRFGCCSADCGSRRLRRRARDAGYSGPAPRPGDAPEPPTALLLGPIQQQWARSIPDAPCAACASTSGPRRHWRTTRHDPHGRQGLDRHVGAEQSSALPCHASDSRRCKLDFSSCNSWTCDRRHASRAEPRPDTPAQVRPPPDTPARVQPARAMVGPPEPPSARVAVGLAEPAELRSMVPP
jgi:hypothetical protein